MLVRESVGCSCYPYYLSLQCIAHTLGSAYLPLLFPPFSLPYSLPATLPHTSKETYYYTLLHIHFPLPLGATNSTHYHNRLSDVSIHYHYHFQK